MHDKSTGGEGTESETRPGLTSGLGGRGDLRRSSLGEETNKQTNKMYLAIYLSNY